MEDGERPWLKPFVHTPVARDPEPGQTRKRPLIYVYELPPWYNSVMLQVRTLLARLPTHRKVAVCPALFSPPYRATAPRLLTLQCLPISPTTHAVPGGKRRLRASIV